MNRYDTPSGTFGAKAIPIGSGLQLPAWAFFLLGLVLVVPLALLTPPFQVPDEMQHFYRAYEIGQPEIKGYLRGQTAGADLPSSLSDMTAHFLGTKAFVSPPVIRRSLRDTLAYAGTPLDPSRTEYTVYTNQIIYSPLAYGPQTLAMAAARFLDAGPLGLLYAGRITNAAVAVLLVTIGLAGLGSARMILIAAALLPMTIYEFASVSADAQVISSAFLYTALALRGLKRGGWTSGQIVLALLSGLIFCTAKFAYLPLLFIAAPALLKGYRRIDVIAFTVVVPVLIGLCTLGWIHHVSAMVLISNPSLQPSNAVDQLAAIHQHPLTLIKVAVHTLAHGVVYVRGMIGILGWLSVPLPVVGYGLGVVALLTAVLVPPQTEMAGPTWMLLFHLLIAGACCVLIAMALYLTWTPPGHDIVDGLQGRYIIPMLPLILVALQGLVARWRTWRSVGTIQMISLTATLANVALCYAIVITRFGLFA